MKRRHDEKSRLAVQPDKIRKGHGAEVMNVIHGLAGDITEEPGSGAVLSACKHQGNAQSVFTLDFLQCPEERYMVLMRPELGRKKKKPFSNLILSAQSNR